MQTQDNYHMNKEEKEDYKKYMLVDEWIRKNTESVNISLVNAPSPPIISLNFKNGFSSHVLVRNNKKVLFEIDREKIMGNNITK